MLLGAFDFRPHRIIYACIRTLSGRPAAGQGYSSRTTASIQAFICIDVSVDAPKRGPSECPKGDAFFAAPSAVAKCFFPRLRLRRRRGRIRAQTDQRFHYSSRQGSQGRTFAKITRGRTFRVKDFIDDMQMIS